MYNPNGSPVTTHPSSGVVTAAVTIHSSVENEINSPMTIITLAVQLILSMYFWELRFNNINVSPIPTFLCPREADRDIKVGEERGWVMHKINQTCN